MTNANNDVRELEDLLTELEGQGALPVGPYSDEDDAVTQLMDAPLGEQEWMVQITPHDRRMMSTEQLSSELQSGVLVQRDMMVWRAGMGDWAPIASIDELRSVLPVSALPPIEPPAPRPLPPPPAPLPPRLGSNINASPGPLSSPRVPVPVPASVPFAMPKPAPMPDVLPPPVMPLSSSPYASPPAPTPDLPSGLPALNSAFNGSASDLKSTAISPGAAPPPAVARVNTARPVAVDFSEMEPRRGTPMRIIIGSSIAALAMIVGTVYGLSAGGVFESSTSTEVSAEHSAPASAASKPASAPAAAPVAAKPSTPAPTQAAPVPKTEEPLTQTVSAKESEPVAVTPAVAAEPEEKSDEKPSKKVKGSDSEERAEAASSEREEVSSSKSERQKARRMKRGGASSEEKEEKKERAKAEPRRSKPRAAVASVEEPRTEEVDQAKDMAGSTFNKQAATAALDDAAAKAKNCRPQGGPSGTGKVQVRYEPNGKVGAVSILTPAFANTTTGDCVLMVFRRANVPAFTGAPAVVLNKNFDIPAN